MVKGQQVASGQLLYVKSDIAGAPTDTEFTTANVTNITDGLACYNSVDFTTYIRSGGVWTTKLQHRRQNLPAYICWFDGTNYRADSMTGGTDYSSTANMATPLNSAFAALTRGQWIHVRSGDYPMGTASPAVSIPSNSFKLTGESFGETFSAASLSTPVPGLGTRFLAGANSQTVFKNSQTAISLSFRMSDFSIYANGFTSLVGIDLSGTETSSVGSRLENVWVDAIATNQGATNGSFATGYILDGVEDTVLSQVGSLSRGPNLDSCTTNILHYDAPAGNINILNPCFLDRGSGITGKWQTMNIVGGTLYGGITYDATVATFNMLEIIGMYWGNGTQHKINLGGFAPLQIAIRGCYINLNTANLFQSGGGTVDTVILENNSINRFAGTTNFADTATNIGRNRLHFRGVKFTGAIGNLPAGIQIDANGYVANGASTTVTAGASIWTGTNSNPWPEIWVLNNLNGGTVSAISYRGDSGYPTTVNGFSFVLGPTDSITVTWATAAPTFKRYPLVVS